MRGGERAAGGTPLSPLYSVAEEHVVAAAWGSILAVVQVRKLAAPPSSGRQLQPVRDDQATS
eukprot:359768-Chlamydomonas_euryale.AAC.5